MLSMVHVCYTAFCLLQYALYTATFVAGQMYATYAELLLGVGRAKVNADKLV